MIAWLRGVLKQKSPDAVVIDVGGVGYQLLVSVNSFCQLPSEGERLALDVYTHVREDQITLYGFLITGERHTFKKLIAVNGIGPRLALNILSGIAPDELVEAIARADLKRLQAVPGVGKRTAERILVDLKDKFTDLPLEATAQAALPTSPATPIRDDLVLALNTLGYKRQEIDRVLKHLTIGPDATIEQSIRDALRLLQPRRK